jgi:hypothetical protein
MSLPGSAAAAAASARTCLRHDDIRAERFCVGCRGPLCSACSRHRGHASCPSCNEAAGQERHRTDLTWLAYLYVDSIVHSWRTAVRRTLPVVAVVSLVAAALFAFAMSQVGELDGGSGEELSMIFAVLTPFFMFGFGVWLQPTLVVPREPAVPFGKQMARAFVGALLPFALLFVVAGLPMAAIFALIDSDGIGLVLLGILGFLVGGVGLLGVLGIVYPIQAAVAVNGDSPLAAFAVPFRAGAGGVTAMLFLHLVLAFTTYTSINAVSMPMMFATLASPWLGLAVGAPLLLGFALMVLLAMGAYGAATLRFSEDRHRLR